MRKWGRGFGTRIAILTHGMLKISTIDTNSERRLVVEGKLVQPWIDEFRQAWHDAGHDLGERQLVVDLGNATVISPEGESALLELMREGARFSCEGVLTRYVLKQLARKCQACVRSVGEKHSRR